MQEEVNNKTVALVVRASKLTATTLYRAMRLYIEHQKKLEMQYKAKRAANKNQPEKKHGKVKVKDLVGENAGAATIEIKDSNIKSFERVARKYNVDFAVKKDKTVAPPKYIIFFKGRDTDVITQAFKDYVHKNEVQAKRPSLKKRLDKYKEIAKKTINRERAREHQKDREQSL